MTIDGVDSQDESCPRAVHAAPSATTDASPTATHQYGRRNLRRRWKFRRFIIHSGRQPMPEVKGNPPLRCCVLETEISKRPRLRHREGNHQARRSLYCATGMPQPGKLFAGPAQFPSATRPIERTKVSGEETAIMRDVGTASGPGHQDNVRAAQSSGVNTQGLRGMRSQSKWGNNSRG